MKQPLLLKILEFFMYFNTKLLKFSDKLETTTTEPSALAVFSSVSTGKQHLFKLRNVFQPIFYSFDILFSYFVFSTLQICVIVQNAMGQEVINALTVDVYVESLHQLAQPLDLSVMVMDFLLLVYAILGRVTSQIQFVIQLMEHVR